MSAGQERVAAQEKEERKEVRKLELGLLHFKVSQRSAFGLNPGGSPEEV